MTTVQKDSSASWSEDSIVGDDATVSLQNKLWQVETKMCVV